MFIHAATQHGLSACIGESRAFNRQYRQKDSARAMTVQSPHLHVAAGSDRRQLDILDAVRDAFVEKGFDGASMQDLARAAGMSVGNFYRYFVSKDAIVAALIARDLSEVERDFAMIIGSDQPMTALRQTLHEHVQGKACNGDGTLWAEITAAAMRKPDIADALMRLEREIRSYLLAVFSRVTGHDAPEAARRFGGHAALIIMLVKASSMGAPISGPHAAELMDLVMRTINRTMDEIETEAMKV
jgi:AcrR family transcriptional regulator